jgi:hypothetical protein
MTIRLNTVKKIQFRGTTFSVGDEVMVYGSKIGVIRNFDQLGTNPNGDPLYCGFVDDHHGQSIAYAAFTDHRRPSGTTGVIVKVPSKTKKN